MFDWLEFPRWWEGVKANAMAVYRPTSVKMIRVATWLAAVGFLIGMIAISYR